MTWPISLYIIWERRNRIYKTREPRHQSKWPILSHRYSRRFKMSQIWSIKWPLNLFRTYSRGKKPKLSINALILTANTMPRACVIIAIISMAETHMQHHVSTKIWKIMLEDSAGNVTQTTCVNPTRCSKPSETESKKATCFTPNKNMIEKIKTQK